jgi:hypothetical protein
MAFSIIVEVNKHFFPRHLPFPDAFGPPAQILLTV